MNLNEVTAYEVIQKKKLTDIRSTGYLLRHIKTGARVMLIENDDENKVFNIAFRTPPKNSTGVAHILEHSVLCGSREFPLKDPFVELVKGSLNTFLNAMTYPDKTVYPIASTNEKDFHNLMEVYLDAVFCPAIYEKPQIFMQEGWHYEFDSAEAQPYYNGVVYSEMKGAFSSVDELMETESMRLLFPNNCYGFVSGGHGKLGKPRHFAGFAPVNTFDRVKIFDFCGQFHLKIRCIKSRDRPNGAAASFHGGPAFRHGIAGWVYRAKAGDNDPAFLFYLHSCTSHSHSAVNTKNLPGDVTGLFPGQESHRRGNIFSTADSACRDGRCGCSAGRLRHSGGHIGFNKSRCHRIGGNVACGVLFGNAFR